ncbi:DUF3800 domain-containing protein [Jiangella anatolica]|uniref:DUF3800 domain-containing protein n=1 Tax=Jiangella anatolica TaxID=2670374 RepID=UPI002D78AB40|nr:DUF3800 domain-containing protein [Jiangella anatolica]
MVAYVDESIRIRDGVYVMAACALEDGSAAAARDAMRELEPRPGHRLHWHDRMPADRLVAVRTVAQLPALHLVTIGVTLDPRRQERARRQCMEALLFHLQDAGVSRVWLETRNAAADRRDIEAVRAARARQIIQYGLLVDHARPSEEPLLWLADIVAGAVSAAEGDDRSYRDPLAPMLTEHRIQLS